MTEFITFGTKEQLSKVPSTSITTGDDSIDSVNQACNLGYHMDSKMRNEHPYKQIMPTLLCNTAEDKSYST